MTHEQREPPSISVVINNYNYDQYLAEAIEHALAQTNNADEIIVVDDGSEDNSLTIVESYAKTRGVKVIAQQNQGQLRAVCNGIGAASGDIIVLLDSDDYYLPGYLDRLRTLYQKFPQVDYVFCAAQCEGTNAAQLKRTRNNLSSMAFPAGNLGATKWAALLFQEYVGIPTSGNSLRRSLANDILPLANAADESIALSGIVAKTLGVSATESKRPGYSADGVIVRCASIVQGYKYYDDRAGFMYRIHGANKYASSSALARRYLRRVREKRFTALLQKTGYLAKPPSATQLRQEIQGRALGKKRLRRLIVRSRYCVEILKSAGSPGEKVRALAAALGLSSVAS